jgi:methionyl-tRNA formyltransferase
MKISNPIVFFGTEDFSLVALTALVESGFNIVAVVTKLDSPRGRGHKMTPPAVKSYAAEHGIPVWQPAKLSEISDDIAELERPAGVLVSYGKIIPQSIIDLFTPGIINVHPSLLPRYRGPSPIEAAILGGDKVTGVSIMQLSAEMDAGPVFQQSRLELKGDETAEDLYESLGKIGSKMLIDLLPSILDGSVTPHPQDETAATYCQLLNKSDGNINWNDAAEVIEARIRAYHLWPKSRTKIGDIDVIITQARVIDDGSNNPGKISVSGNELRVGTGNGQLDIVALMPLGKKEMPVTAFLSGYRSRIIL